MPSKRGTAAWKWRNLQEKRLRLLEEAEAKWKAGLNPAWVHLYQAQLLDRLGDFQSADDALAYYKRLTDRDEKAAWQMSAENLIRARFGVKAGTSRLIQALKADREAARSIPEAREVAEEMKGLWREVGQAWKVTISTAEAAGQSGETWATVGFFAGPGSVLAHGQRMLEEWERRLAEIEEPDGFVALSEVGGFVPLPKAR